MFHAFKESFFQGLEDFLARRKSGSDGIFGGEKSNNVDVGGEGGEDGGDQGAANETQQLFWRY